MKFKDSDLTPIYPPHIKPARVGYYPAAKSSTCGALGLYVGKPIAPCYWDGKYWFYDKDLLEICLHQDMYWRGLNRDPKMIAKERGE